MYAYVGTRTTRERNARGEGISVFRCDAATGALSLVQVLGDLSNPSYLMVHPRQSVLYTVHGDGGEISAFNAMRSRGRSRSGTGRPAKASIPCILH